MPASEQTEPLVKDLPEKWLREQADYPDSPEGQHAAAAVRTNAAELKAAVIRERDAPFWSDTAKWWKLWLRASSEITLPSMT